MLFGLLTLYSAGQTDVPTHAAGVWSGFLQYLRKPDWADEPERIPPRRVQLRAV